MSNQNHEGTVWGIEQRIEMPSIVYVRHGNARYKALVEKGYTTASIDVRGLALMVKPIT